MTDTLTCIVCPNGCELTVGSADDGVTVTGAACPKGRAYAVREMTDPRRTFSTSVRVLGGAVPLCSVRLTKPIPKAGIMEAVRLIHAVKLKAPVMAGTVLIRGLLGTDSDVITTSDVPAVPDVRAASDKEACT